MRNGDEKFSEVSETENKVARCVRNDSYKSISSERVTFESLAKSIADHGFVEHLEEITDNIVNPGYKFAKDIKKKVIDWSVRDVTEWIMTLNFLNPDNEHIATSLEQECVNGMALMDISLVTKWSELGLETSHYYMIRCIIDGWTRGYGKAMICPPGVPAGVVAGITADLSYCSVKEAQELVDADAQCIERGIGYIYGQLVVLGYKEHRIQGDAWQPVGWSNDKFIMKRRKLPNGIRQNRVTRPDMSELLTGTACADMNYNRTQQTSHTLSISYNYGALSEYGSPAAVKEEDKIVFEYVPDPSKDMFQVGRVATNDFIVKGPLHYDNAMVTCGPVSRYACRIEVERRAPFRAFVFAAGFNTTKDISLGVSAPKWFDKDASPDDRWRSFDALTTYGVKLWRPDIREWCEISVQGNAFRPRTVSDEVGMRLGPPFTNELIDGSIIDICGVVFLFQNPVTMAKLIRKHVNPVDVIYSLNSLRPQCPVLFNSITFSYINSEERVRRAYHRLETSGESYSSVGPMHIPTTNYDHVEEEHRSYVFPSCGHVHGYHKSLQDRPCPLCRKKGAFVPIAFAFEPAICYSARPTHVFNPCGHVASRSVCERWSNIPMHGSNAVSQVLKPFCPFCATVLHGPNEGGPYNRLILQTESGEAWESNEDDSDEFTHTPPSSQGPQAPQAPQGPQDPEDPQGPQAPQTPQTTQPPGEAKKNEITPSSVSSSISSRASFLTDEHVNSCHTLLFLKDQATMNAKLKNESYTQSADLTKMRVITPEFPKYTPQLDLHYGL